ncbi:unnamed protein product [Protopolystoma xenopodis]|uniref:Uncharacterized protein n=1 Tax=Protopolystoma xenopodis TaxID=117903 RepID=A0A3S5AW68_9PLAT|nr:unnamed protein product [Protopolystoma xenopodis]
MHLSRFPYFASYLRFTQYLLVIFLKSTSYSVVSAYPANQPNALLCPISQRALTSNPAFNLLLPASPLLSLTPPEGLNNLASTDKPLAVPASSEPPASHSNSPPPIPPSLPPPPPPLHSPSLLHSSLHQPKSATLDVISRSGRSPETTCTVTQAPSNSQFIFFSYQSPTNGSSWLSNLSNATLNSLSSASTAPTPQFVSTSECANTTSPHPSSPSSQSSSPHHPLPQIPPLPPSLSLAQTSPTLPPPTPLSSPFVTHLSQTSPLQTVSLLEPSSCTCCFPLLFSIAAQPTGPVVLVTTDGATLTPLLLPNTVASAPPATVALPASAVSSSATLMPGLGPPDRMTHQQHHFVTATHSLGREWNLPSSQQSWADAATGGVFHLAAGMPSWMRRAYIRQGGPRGAPVQTDRCRAEDMQSRGQEFSNRTGWSRRSSHVDGVYKKSNIRTGNFCERDDSRMNASQPDSSKAEWRNREGDEVTEGGAADADTNEHGDNDENGNGEAGQHYMRDRRKKQEEDSENKLDSLEFGKKQSYADLEVEPTQSCCHRHSSKAKSESLFAGMKQISKNSGNHL